MNKLIHAIIAIFIVLIALIIYINLTQTSHNIKENFTVGECPTEAFRDSDGRIHTKPDNGNFTNMSEYVSYLENLYKNGKTCIPPLVSGNEIILESNETPPPINKLDDYEYSHVMESENAERTGMIQAVKNARITDNILDWAKLPFNSEERAAKEDAFIAGREDPHTWQEPKTGVFFRNIEGADILPPDEDEKLMNENKILSSYKPPALVRKYPESETETVAKLVHDIYAKDENWEPVVQKVDGNKWEVVELRPKPRKEEYEDNKIVTAEDVNIPSVNIINNLQDDPYFDKSGVVDRANNRFWNYKDFNKWTPGLERMFAPTHSIQEWY